jgi:putative spermidine/putrescine transport system permease protein
MIYVPSPQVVLKVFSMADLAQPKPSAQPIAPSFTIPWTWLGAVPFFAFIGAFLFWPAVSIVIQSFFDQQRRFTIQNLLDLSQPFVANAYIYTIQVSLASALAGGILGFLLAYAVTVGALPRSIRSALLTFSGVASNFAGIPLAFAFIATIGQLGVITQGLKAIGINLYPAFSLYTFWGLVLTYTYFQIPLMVLIMAPAFDGLRREWSEAAQNLGATSWQYWRYVALPILTPSILGTMVLLFGNAFGAQATAFALTGGASGGQVITILIGSQLSGDSLANPGIGNAMAFGMIAIMSLTIGIYTWLQRQSERWVRS